VAAVEIEGLNDRAIDDEQGAHDVGRCLDAIEVEPLLCHGGDNLRWVAVDHCQHGPDAPLRRRDNRQAIRPPAAVVDPIDLIESTAAF
jgi:hypothetical protein